MLRRLWRHLHATSCTSSSANAHVHENNRGPVLVPAATADDTPIAITGKNTTNNTTAGSSGSGSSRTASRISRKRDKEKSTTNSKTKLTSTAHDKPTTTPAESTATANGAAGAKQTAVPSNIAPTTNVTSATNVSAAAPLPAASTSSPVPSSTEAAPAQSDAAAHAPPAPTSYNQQPQQEEDDDDDGVIGFLDNVIAGNTDQLRKEFAEQKLLSMAQSLPSATKPLSLGTAPATSSSSSSAEAAKAGNVAAAAKADQTAAPGVATAAAAIAKSKDEAKAAVATSTTALTAATASSSSSNSKSKPPQTSAAAATAATAGTSSSNNNNKQAAAVTSNTHQTSYVSSAARSLQEYELVAYLGSGTFAEVTLARHRRTQELFAIKKTSKQRVREEGCVQRTFTERQLLTSMRHPFLVRLFQAFQSPTHLYYVLEFAQGGDLYYFNESKPWVRETKRSLYKLNYPYYVSSVLPAAGSSRRTRSFGSGATSNNNGNQSGAEESSTMTGAEAWGWRLSAAQLAHNRSFGACSMLTEDDPEMTNNMNRSFSTREEAKTAAAALAASAMAQQPSRQTAAPRRSGRNGNGRRMPRRRQRLTDNAADKSNNNDDERNAAEGGSPARASLKTNDATLGSLGSNNNNNGTLAARCSPARCESSGGASPLRRRTTDVASPTPCTPSSANDTAVAAALASSGETKTPQTVSIAALLLQQEQQAAAAAAATFVRPITTTPPLRPSPSTSVAGESATPTPRKAVSTANDEEDGEDVGGDAKEPSKTPVPSLTATPRKTKAAEAASAGQALSAARPRRVDVLGARYVERHLEDCTVALPRPYAEDGTRLPIRIIAFFAIEIALVLQYMHGEGFIYRDLKPENILIKRDGHITLTDFGVAKYRKGAAIPPVQSSTTSATEGNASAARKTAAEPEATAANNNNGTSKVERTTSFTGTTHYMSPEMLQGLPHDFRTDWWSYGCLLFEWTNGHKAFDNPSQFALFRSIVEEDVKIDEAADFRITALELHRRTAQLYRRFQQTASMQAVSLAASASRLAASVSAEDGRRHDGAWLSRRGSTPENGRLRNSSVASLDHAAAAHASVHEEGEEDKAAAAAAAMREEPERHVAAVEAGGQQSTSPAKAHDDEEEDKKETSAARTEPPSLATTPPNNASFPPATLQSFAALSFAGASAAAVGTPRSRSGSKRLTLPPQLALERLQRRALSHEDRDLLLSHAATQLAEAMGLLRQLILALLDRRMERRLCGAAVLAHPFFSCSYVVSQLYYSHAFLAEMLARHAGPAGHATPIARQEPAGMASSVEASPTAEDKPTHNEKNTNEDDVAKCLIPDARPSADPSIITLGVFLRETVHLRRPPEWATLFLNLQIRPPYIPRLRAQDDLRYFPSAVTAMGLSVMAEQRKKLKEAHDLQRQQEQQQQLQEQQQQAQAHEQERWRQLSFRANASGRTWHDIYSFAVPDMPAAGDESERQPPPRHEANAEEKTTHHGHRRHRQRRMLQNLSFPDESVLRRMRQAREANEAIASARKKTTASKEEGDDKRSAAATKKTADNAEAAKAEDHSKSGTALPASNASHTRRSHSAEVPSTTTHVYTEEKPQALGNTAATENTNTLHAQADTADQPGGSCAAQLMRKRDKSVTIVHDERSHAELPSSLTSLPDSHNGEDKGKEEESRGASSLLLLPQVPRRVQSAGLPETPTLLAQLPSPSESILTPTRTGVFSRAPSNNEVVALGGTAAAAAAATATNAATGRRRQRLVSVRAASVEATVKEGTASPPKPPRRSPRKAAHVDTSLMTATNTTVGSSASDEDEDEDDEDYVDAGQKQRSNDVLARAAKLPQDFVAAALAVGAATKSTAAPSVTTAANEAGAGAAVQPKAPAEVQAADGHGESTAAATQPSHTATASPAAAAHPPGEVIAAATNTSAAAAASQEQAATPATATVKSYYEADALELNEASPSEAHEPQEKEENGGSASSSAQAALPPPPPPAVVTAPASVMNASTTVNTTTTTTTTTAAVTPSLETPALGSVSEGQCSPALPEETIMVMDRLQPCHSRVVSFTPSLSSTARNTNAMQAALQAAAIPISSSSPPPSPQPRIEAALASTQQAQQKELARNEEHHTVSPVAESTEEVVTREERGGRAGTSITPALLSSHATGKPPLWAGMTTLTASVHSAPLQPRRGVLFSPSETAAGMQQREEDEEEEEERHSSAGSYHGSSTTDTTVSRRSRSCTSETASMASRSSRSDTSSSSSSTRSNSSSDSEHSSTATSTSITSSGSDLANLMACSTPFGFGTSPEMTQFMRVNPQRVISVPGARPSEGTTMVSVPLLCPAPQPALITDEHTTTSTNDAQAAAASPASVPPAPYSPAETSELMHYGADNVAGGGRLAGNVDEALLASLQTIARPRPRRNQNMMAGLATLRGIAYNVEEEPYTRYHPRPRNVVAAGEGGMRGSPTGQGTRRASYSSEAQAGRPAHHLDPMAQLPDSQTLPSAEADFARSANKVAAFTAMDTRRNSAASPLNLSRTQPDTMLGASAASSATHAHLPGVSAAMATSPLQEYGVTGVPARPAQPYRVRALRNTTAAAAAMAARGHTFTSNSTASVPPPTLQLTTGSDSDGAARLSSATQSPKYLSRPSGAVLEEGETATTAMSHLPHFFSRAVVHGHNQTNYYYNNNSSGNEHESDAGSRSTGSPVQPARTQFAMERNNNTNTNYTYGEGERGSASGTLTPLTVGNNNNTNNNTSTASAGPVSSPLYVGGGRGSAAFAQGSHPIPLADRSVRSTVSYDTPPSDLVTGASYGGGFDHFMNFSFAAPFPVSQTLRASVGTANVSSNASGAPMGSPYCVSATNSVSPNTAVSEVHDT